MTVAPHVLRRYVIDRASGRSPRSEWSYHSPDIGAWILSDEATARRHEHHRRIRMDGLPWCDILGHRTDVADDETLQIYFLTVASDGWSSHAIAVMRAPKRCLREWRSAGSRIIAAVNPEAAPSAMAGSGPLSGWPQARGTGPRSMLPR